MPRSTPFRSDDIYQLSPVSDPRISPDGTRVAFVQERRERKQHKVYTRIQLVDFEGGEPRPLTADEQHDALPRWSPDGRWLAFVRTREQAAQIWLLPMQGGEPRQLTSLPHGSISQIDWSPAGDRIGFRFRPLGDRVELDDKGEPRPPVYRHIKRWFNRLDGLGFFGSTSEHIWSVQVSSGRTRQLSDGDWDDRFFAWSPDGKRIAFVGCRREDWEYHLEEDSIYVMGRNGGKVTEIASVRGPKAGLSWSPDGSQLAFIGHSRPRRAWGVYNYRLWLVPAEGGRARCLTPQLEANLFPLTLGDHTPCFGEEPPLWTPDGSRVVVLSSHRGGAPLLSVDASGGELETLVDDRHVVVGVSQSSDGQRLAVLVGSLEGPDEICALEPGHKPKPLTAQRQIMRRRRHTPTEELVVKRGSAEIHGFLQKPPDFKPDRRYPLLLYIHGGPRGQYGRVFFHEMQTLAAAGYLVLYTNPRGSQGYGEAFADAITGKWAEPAMGDVLAAVDHVVGLGCVDPERMGVLGGSYGGYLTNWIISHTNRFAAAITQRSVVDLRSMAGSSDVGLDIEWEFGADPWKNDTNYRKWSPLTYVRRIRTPLLIMHSENDLRCNVEQADQLFMALKRERRTVEYVRFPEESHGLSRGGRPDRRVKRIDLVIEWFDRWLKP